MAYWDSENQKVIYTPLKDLGNGWVEVDCGCCAGIQWSGGYEAVECPRCWGNGVRCVHLKSGTVVAWPGGPLLGAHHTKEELDRLREFIDNDGYNK